MRTQLYKTAVIIGLVAIFAAPALAQKRYEFWRRDGRVGEMREVERPALIEALAQTSDPVALSISEFAQLKSYLVAASRPRRLDRDRFYQGGSGGSGSDNGAEAEDRSRMVLDDPEQLSVMYPEIERVKDWERLRMHFIFNEELHKAAYSGQDVPAVSNGAQNVEPRKTIAVQVGAKIYWFAVEECQQSWTSRSPHGGALFLTADGQFVLLSPYADLTGSPARFVQDEPAVIWLATNGYEMPKQLAHAADGLRLDTLMGQDAPSDQYPTHER